MDAAFFQRGILHLLTARDCGYAIKVGYWSWLPLKTIAGACRRWQPVAPGVTGHETELIIPQWNNLRLRVVPYRKHVHHETRRNFQLDLFTPDDGHYEYSAVATNLPLGLSALWAFACGRGAQEKTFAELKGEFALDVVPTKHYAANSAWQQLSILAHNLIRSFQLETLAEPKPRSRKRTYAYLFRNMRTIRFLLIARAGRLSPTRRPERAPPDQEPRDRDPVWADRSPSGGLIIRRSGLEVRAHHLRPTVPEYDEVRRNQHLAKAASSACRVRVCPKFDAQPAPKPAPPGRPPRLVAQSRGQQQVLQTSSLGSWLCRAVP